MHLRNVEVVIMPSGEADVRCRNMSNQAEHQVENLVILAMRSRAGCVSERIRSYVAVATGIIPSVVVR